MAIFKNIAEPGAVVLIFTVGTLINRRSKRHFVSGEDEGVYTPLLQGKPTQSRPPKSSWIPDNSKFRNNPVSRFLAFFPFLIEIWYWLLAYWIYQVSRAYSAYLIRENEAVLALSRTHAVSVLALEARLNVAIERPLQAYILTHQPWLMRILSTVYVSHILVGIVFLVYTYTYLPILTYQRIRRTIALDNWLAFALFTTWRCMPPRLLPTSYGFVDILHQGPASAWTRNRFQLTIAAMPSLHFGTSLLLAVCILRFSPHMWLRVVAPLWPAAMLVTILATANHFLLDAVVGACIPLLGWKMNEVLLLLRPLEEWGFWLCRTEKPEPGEGRAVAEGLTIRKAGEFLA